MEDVAALSIHLPAFWLDFPDVWFASIDATFDTSSITTEKIKFYKVVAALPQNIARNVLEITRKAEYEKGDYAKLKYRILNEYQLMKQERFNKLVCLKKVQNRKHLRFLHDNQNLLDKINMGASDIKATFLSCAALRALLPSIKAVLSVLDNMDLDALADKEDYFKVSPLENLICETTIENANSQQRAANNHQIDKIVERVVAEIASSSSKILNNKVVQKQREHRTNTSSSKWLCYYHNKFGKQARRCELNCIMYLKN